MIVGVYSHKQTRANIILISQVLLLIQTEKAVLPDVTAAPLQAACELDIEFALRTQVALGVANVLVDAVVLQRDTLHHQCFLADVPLSGNTVVIQFRFRRYKLKFCQNDSASLHTEKRFTRLPIPVT